MNEPHETIAAPSKVATLKLIMPTVVGFDEIKRWSAVMMFKDELGRMFVPLALGGQKSQWALGVYEPVVIVKPEREGDRATKQRRFIGFL